ncbi:MFS transporter [Phaeospirillum tilakii]|uniref:MFS transporter n=1 Tax=Phaeospirillum tilakii TaxID=741673 RepID=A0ABW5C6L8_9PROT
MPSLLRALHHRNYRLFFTGQLISLIGTWMQSVAQSWLVYRMTGSSEMLGLIGFVAQGPVFLLSTLGGVVADRFDRRRILLLTQSVSMALAVLLAALTLSDEITLPALFTIAALLGITNAFDIPTRQSFVVEMVERADLANAIALNSSLFNGARLFGPAVAGLLVAAGGEGWCFAFNAASFVAVLAGLLAMRLAPRPPRAEARLGVFASIGEGIRFVLGQGAIRDLMGMLGLSSLMAMFLAVLLPIYADRILGGGAASLGLLMSASGLGAFLAALRLAARTSPAGLDPWPARGALLFGLCLIGFSLSPWLWLSAAIQLVAGFAFMIQTSSTNTLIQLKVPDAYRGRTMALYSMMFVGMAPFGTLAGGLLAGQIGPAATVAVAGGTIMAGGVVYILLHRRRPERVAA